MTRIKDIATIDDYRAAIIWNSMSEMDADIPNEMADELMDSVVFSKLVVDHIEQSGLTYSEIADDILSP